MFGPSNPEQSDCVRKGSSGVVESIMLLHSNQMMHAPYTQVFKKTLSMTFFVSNKILVNC